MPTRHRAERGRLITISVAALFAMLVMGAASAQSSGNPAAYTRSLSLVSKLGGTKFVSARIASAPVRSATRIEAVAKSLRQAASDFDLALVAVCLLLEISLVFFAWRISSPSLIPIPIRHNGPWASRAPPSF